MHRAARPQGTPAELLETGQSAQRIEALRAPVQGEQVVLLERAGLEFPDSFGTQGIVLLEQRAAKPAGRECHGQWQWSWQARQQS